MECAKYLSEIQGANYMVVLFKEGMRRTLSNK